MASPTEAEDIKTLKRLMGKHLKTAFVAGFKRGQSEQLGEDFPGGGSFVAKSGEDYWEEYWKKGEED